ncbi:MAG: hypothetical protein Q7J30_02210 [Candidatus Azambacteria bacterium]|nr:hypothetical protein [Candidatus Azambacteria bacterium]
MLKLMYNKLMNGELKIPPIEELNKKGTELYESLKLKLEPGKNGFYIAIEIESGNYAVAETSEKAMMELRTKYPDKLFFVRRIGELSKISLRIPDNYARIF